MSTIRTSGLGELTKALEEFSAELPDVERELLEAGAEVVVEAWQKGIEEAGHVDTGQMRDSVRATINRNATFAEIYPKGKDKKGVRNAEKAFILHYGKTGESGDRFVDKIEDNAEEPATEAMAEKLNEKLTEKGLI